MAAKKIVPTRKVVASALRDHVAGFERRAKRFRYEAYFILAVIFLLIGVGAYVFYRAPQIATSDLFVNIEEQIVAFEDDLRKKNDELKTLHDKKIN